MITRVTSSSPDEVHAIAKVLADSFNLNDDPLFGALYGGGVLEDGPAFNELRFRGRVYESIRTLETYIVEEGGRVAAAMVIEPPGSDPTPYSAEIEAKTVPAVAEAQKQLRGELHAFEDTVFGDESYYVSFLATAPWARRQGHAGRLLRYILDKANAAGCITTLTTVTEGNLSYYSKFGFRVIGQTTVDVRGKQLTLWALNNVAKAV